MGLAILGPGTAKAWTAWYLVGAERVWRRSKVEVLHAWGHGTGGTYHHPSSGETPWTLERESGVWYSPPTPTTLLVGLSVSCGCSSPRAHCVASDTNWTENGCGQLMMTKWGDTGGILRRQRGHATLWDPNPVRLIRWRAPHKSTKGLGCVSRY